MLFLIAFLAEAFIRYIIIMLTINYIIIICVNDSSAVINNDYGRLQDLIKIPIVTRKDFFEVYRQFGHAPSKSFAGPELDARQLSTAFKHLQANALLSVLDARRSLAGPPPQTW
jgi:hypothetical protein